jgi:hypothetical protein
VPDIEDPGRQTRNNEHPTSNIQPSTSNGSEGGKAGQSHSPAKAESRKQKLAICHRLFAIRK